MVVAVGLGSGSCLDAFLRSNLFISCIDSYTCCEVFWTTQGLFYLWVWYWFYFIYSMMGHRACSIFATPSV